MLLAGCAHTAPPVAPTPEEVARSVPEARAHAWYLKARAAEALGDDEMAARGLSWADRLDRDDPELHRLLAEHAARRGDDEGALSLCLDALDAHPNAPDCELGWAHRGAARAWLRLGHAGDARAHLDALGACPSPELEARWRWAMGDADAARAALDAASPSLPEERLDAARLALQLDRADLALTWVAPVVGHPAWPEAAEVLAEVAPHHPDAVRTLLRAIAPTAGSPWTDLLARLEAP